MHPPVKLRGRVCAAYSAAARDPRGSHPFPLGREFAASVGYPEGVLARLPEASVAAFSGVSNLPLTAAVAPGATVADIGCGAGMDSLILAERTGPDGRVIGIDFSPDMLAVARAGASSPHIFFCCAGAEKMPLAGDSVDCAFVN